MPESISVTDAIMRHEQHLADFYIAVAEGFPEEGQVFSRLAVEEHVHIQHLRQLLQAVTDGQVRMQPSTLNRQTIEDSIRRIEANAARLAGGELDFGQVLAIARDLEGSMIEKRYFQVFDTRQSQFRELTSRIYEDTVRHHDALQTALDRWRACRA